MAAEIHFPIKDIFPENKPALASASNSSDVSPIDDQAARLRQYWRVRFIA